MFLPKPPKLVKALYSQLVWEIPNNDNTIYLTFDDGPTPGITDWVLDLLKEHQIKATFFCLGKNVAAHPELYQRILDEGHAVGNHSYHHLSGWKTKDEEYFQDIDKASHVIDSKLFRPPYGRITKSQARYLNEYYQIIMWNVLSGDFDPKTTPEKCLSNVLNHTQSGSIIVFHDSEKAASNLKYALPRAIEGLNKEFRFGIK